MTGCTDSRIIVETSSTESGFIISALTPTSPFFSKRHVMNVPPRFTATATDVRLPIVFARRNMVPLESDGIFFRFVAMPFVCNRNTFSKRPPGLYLLIGDSLVA